MQAFRIPGSYSCKALGQTNPLPDPNTPGTWRREGERTGVNLVPVENHYSKQKRKSKGHQGNLNKKCLSESKGR